MQIEFTSIKDAAGSTGALALVGFEDALLSGPIGDLNEATGGAIGRALAGGRFTGEPGQTLQILAPHGIDAAQLVLVGGGKQAEFGERAAEIASARAYQAVKTSGVKSLTIRLPVGGGELAAHGALGVTLGAYRFDRYRTTEKPEKKPSVASVKFGVSKPAAAEKAWKKLSTLADAIVLARDLVSEPANILFPEEFARRVKRLASLGLEVEILGEKEMRKLFRRVL